MKGIVLLVSLLWSASAMAQGLPPTQGFPPPPGSPPVAAQPAAAPAAAPAKPKVAKKRAAPKPPAMTTELQACLAHDDNTKLRLDCYDAVFTPQPKPKAPKARAAIDCRFLKEEDERLSCFNKFAAKLPKSKWRQRRRSRRRSRGLLQWLLQRQPHAAEVEVHHQARLIAGKVQDRAVLVGQDDGLRAADDGAARAGRAIDAFDIARTVDVADGAAQDKSAIRRR